MVDRYDEQLHLRCQGLTADVPAIAEDAKPYHAPSSPSGPGSTADGRVGLIMNDFKIGSVLRLLHMQPFDSHKKQKVGTGLLSHLVIPETVAFRSGDPAFPCWYLSSKADPGTIKRKNSFNLTPRNIVEAFTKRRKRSVQKGLSGIIAVLVSDARPNAGISEGDEFGEAQVEYLDEVGLRHFLDRRVTSFSGILQQWVDPKGSHNSQLHCLWAVSLCQVTCKTNTRALSDRRCSMYERAVTFDGAESFTRRDPVSTQTQQVIENLCVNMVRHVERMTVGRCRITSFSSYWKVRPDGQVVFLWCSSLKAAAAGAGMPEIISSRSYSPILSVPHEVDVRERQERARPYVCPVSNNVLGVQDVRHFITYKMIIAEWDATHQAPTARQRPSSAGFRPMSAQTPRQPPPSEAPPTKPRPTSARTLRDCSIIGKENRAPDLSPIPPLIRKLESLADESLYRRLLTDASFLYKQLRVTEDVARHFFRYVDTAEALDRALLQEEGMGRGVSIVPNLDGRPSISRASARSGSSPFVDIMSDTHEGVPSLNLSRLSPVRNFGGRSGVESSQRSSARSSAAPMAAPIQREGAGSHRSAPPGGGGYRDACAGLSLGAEHRSCAGTGGKRDRASIVRANARGMAALNQHKKRLKAAEEDKARQHESREGALQSRPPPPPKRPPENPAAHLLAEGRRGMLHSAIGGISGLGSLKALVPQLRLAREMRSSQSPDKPRTDRNQSDEQMLLSDASSAAGRGLEGYSVHSKGYSVRQNDPRSGLGKGVARWYVGTTSWPEGALLASEQQKKVKLLFSELETHVTAHTSHSHTVYDLMDQARQQLSLPPIMTGKKSSTGSKRTEGLHDSFVQQLADWEKVVTRMEAAPSAESPESHDSVQDRAMPDGQEDEQYVKKAEPGLNVDEQSEDQEEEEWSDDDEESEVSIEEMLEQGGARHNREGVDADAVDADADLGSESANLITEPPSKGQIEEEQVLGSLMESLGDQEKEYFLQVLQTAGLC